MVHPEVPFLIHALGAPVHLRVGSPGPVAGPSPGLRRTRSDVNSKMMQPAEPDGTSSPDEASSGGEDAIRTAFAAEDLTGAATRTIEDYGGEVLGFLVARLGPTAGQDVFSMFCEDLWTGLPGFRWQCTMRSYCYTLARNAANRFVLAPANRPDRRHPLSASSDLMEAVDRVRSRTAPFLRTEVKSRMRELRERLSEEEQCLLILRVDRGLSWREIAAVLGADGEVPEAAQLAQQSARWRKRFQLTKEKLREMARQEGLLES